MAQATAPILDSTAENRRTRLLSKSVQREINCIRIGGRRGL